jgi:hypothetical protein
LAEDVDVDVGMSVDAGGVVNGRHVYRPAWWGKVAELSRELDRDLSRAKRRAARRKSCETSRED